MRLERVLQMPFTEVMARGRQEASKWWDRLASGAPRAPAAAAEGMCRLMPDRFFEGVTGERTAAEIVALLPAHRDRMLAAADAVCRGRFDLLGYRELDFGDPIDWHLDPVSGRRAPLMHWSRLQPLDPAAVGDSKVVWELNRHQWLLRLGQAYRFTGDERYAEAFARNVRAWMQDNPTGMGINWASSLEVAFRLISWCWALSLFDGSPALSGDLRAGMEAAVAGHARHVERYLSYYFSPNTHLTGEALGLFYAGVLFPTHRRAGRWRRLGTRILVDQCRRQILADGVYFEQSTCYQRYTAEIYLHFLILGCRNGIGIPSWVAERVQRLLDFLMALRLPDGSMPLIGDADGGWLLPLAPRAPHDLRGVMAVAAAVFGRADYAWAAGGPAPELLWMVGEAGRQVLSALTPAPPSASPSRLFPEGGYAVMRTGWEPDAHQLVLSTGRLGGTSRGAHGHADLLALHGAVFGEPILVDPGTDGYTAHAAWRDFFRSTNAHSTVLVDRRPQADPAGPFTWASRPRARLLRWTSTATLDRADAEHDAYRCLPDPVTHRRRVIFVKPRYWVVVDDLRGTTEHRVDLQFQFAPVPVTVDAGLWGRVRGPGGRGLLFRPFSAAPIGAEVCAGRPTPPGGWVAPDYGRRRPAPMLTYTVLAPLPLRLVTVLLPAADLAAPPPRVRWRGAGVAEPVELVWEETGETLIVDDRDVRLVPGRDTAGAPGQRGASTWTW